MYVIVVSSRKLEKKYRHIKETTTDENGYCRIADVLKNFPKGNETTHKEISKKGKYWAYDLSWGDRVVYKVYDHQKIKGKPMVAIYFIGNHKDYETYLRKER